MEIRTFVQVTNTMNYGQFQWLCGQGFGFCEEPNLGLSHTWLLKQCLALPRGHIILQPVFDEISECDDELVITSTKAAYTHETDDAMARHMKTDLSGSYGSAIAPGTVV
jgi:hypothetical protein